MLKLCIIILEIILIQFAASEEERFFWENDYVGKPVNFYHGAAYQIPVIEGETVDIQCKVRAVSEDIYTIIWDYENFHANTTGKTVLVNNTDGDEYAQDTITVTIDNPADIDDRDIICSWENAKFSDTITLQFKVYVPDNSDNSQHCGRCKGDLQLKLKRAYRQKNEDINLEEKIIQKVMRKYNVGDVFVDSNDYICACKPRSPTLNNDNFPRKIPISIIIVLNIYIFAIFANYTCSQYETILEDILRYFVRRKRKIIYVFARSLQEQESQVSPEVRLQTAERETLC